MTRRLFACAAAFAAGSVLALTSDAAAQILHTPHDHVPNFAANPTIRSAANGAWSSPLTWIPNRLPAPADIVSVTHTVTYDSTIGDANVIGIDAGGVLRFSIGQSTRLRVGTLLVLPGGTLEIGTAATPVPAYVTAEIIIKDNPLNTSIDPDQYGTGLLSIDGTVTIHGAVKTFTFVRTASEPRIGHTTISLEQPVAGWRVGDRIVLPDTRQVPAEHWFDPGYGLQVEQRTIQSISPDAMVDRALVSAQLRSPGCERCGRHAHRRQRIRSAPAPPGKPDAQRHHPLGEPFGHQRPHVVHASFERGHRVRAVSGSWPHARNAARCRHQPHRAVPAAHPSALGSGKSCERRISVRASRQRRQRQPQVADRRARESLRTHQAERRVWRRLN